LAAPIAEESVVQSVRSMHTPNCLTQLIDSLPVSNKFILKPDQEDQSKRTSSSKMSSNRNCPLKTKNSTNKVMANVGMLIDHLCESIACISETTSVAGLRMACVDKGFL
jgi:hypothetical protein